VVKGVILIAIGSNPVAFLSLPNHFASFFGRLNPGASFEATASTQYNTIKGLIEDRSGRAAELAPTCFLQGSYKQQTAIYSISDIDIVSLCRLWSPGTGVGRGYSRDQIFDIVAAPLRNDGRYSSKVRYGPTSMCIKVDLGIKVEILPVVFKAGNNDSTKEPFRLYRPASSAWEDGYARYHQSYLSRKNGEGRADGNFIPAVKVFKHLRSLNRLEAVSFHIECLLHLLPDSLFLGCPADYIPALLNNIAAEDAATWYRKAVRTPCGDRDIFTSNEWGADSWCNFHAWVRYWAQNATAARDAREQNSAIRLWKAVLGNDYFPEQVR
jgi:hypothetical protein